MTLDQLLKEMKSGISNKIVIGSTVSLVAVALKERMWYTPVDLLSAKNWYVRSDYKEITNFLLAKYLQLTPTNNNNSSSPKVETMGELLTDLMFGNPFVDNRELDVLITTDDKLSEEIRRVRDSKKKLLSFNDFTIIPLIPVNYLVLNQVDYNQTAIVKQIVDLLDVCVQFQLNSTNMNCNLIYSKHDYCWLRSLSGMLSISTNEEQLLNDFAEQQISKSLSFNLNITTNIISKYKEETINNYNNRLLSIIFNNETNTFLTITPHLFNFTCYQCSSSICLYEPLIDSEYFHYVAVFSGFLMYLSLIFMWSKKSILKRLTIPYLCTFCVMIRMFISGQYLYEVSPILYSTLSIVSVAIIVVVYAFTIVRYFYLRNLYSIISNTKRIYFHKILSSTWMGIFISIILTFLTITILFPSCLFYFKTIYLKSSFQIIRNVFLGVIIVLGIFCSLIASVIDIYFNREIIKKKGFFNFVFFDDPFYVRIDMMSIVLLLILLGPFLAPTRVEALVGLFRMVMGIVGYFLCGGTAMVIEIVKVIKLKVYKKLKKNNSIDSNNNQQGEFDSLLSDISFFNLLKEYCEKEFSLENIVLYEKLMELKRKGFVTFTELQYIYDQFIKTYSAYEINLPSATKKQFMELLTVRKDCLMEMELKEEGKRLTTEEKEIGGVEYGKVDEILMNDIIVNLSDTYSRLQQTSRFQEWETIKAMQMKANV
ncbi:hypothetical protein ABK040_010642 [Willaertia magna]